jgi:hypothetical protein
MSKDKAAENAAEPTEEQGLSALKSMNDIVKAAKKVPVAPLPGNEVCAREPKGPRDFFYSRKISLKNYDPRRQYETEDFGVTHDSFGEARACVQAAVENRIAELRGVKEHETKN